MSIDNSTESDESRVAAKPLVRVHGFIDGFNLYHALNKLDRAVNRADETRYHKYKWLCLTTLINCFVLSNTERLAGVTYFTAYPNWEGSKPKTERHQTYVSAQISRGVQVTLGRFKTKETECRYCQGVFDAPVEKETDINIAISMINLADKYDKAILLTGDSDQVSTVRLLKKLYPEKVIASLPPIGRSAKDLAKVCDLNFKMTEQHLIDSQLPNPMPGFSKGKQTSYFFVKPSNWV